MNLKQHKNIYANWFIHYQLSTINHKCVAKRNYYTSGLGRFTGKDPWTGQPDDVRFVGFRLNNFILHNLLFSERSNLYFYVDNNSLNYVDFSGNGLVDEGKYESGKKLRKKGHRIEVAGTVISIIFGVAALVLVFEPSKVPAFGCGCVAVGSAFWAASGDRMEDSGNALIEEYYDWKIESLQDGDSGGLSGEI